jgi:hypothetical protein
LRPRKEEASKEAYELLRKAKKISERIDTLEKAQPGYSTAFKTSPHDISLESESGGRTRNAHYNTNNHLLEAKDVKNAGASKSSVDLDSMGKKLNTHDKNAGHEEFAGGDGPKLD